MIVFKRFFILSFCVLASCQSANTQKKYPQHWWAPIKGEAHSWEITPDQVRAPQVILSKRNELGLLSNFAETPFELDGHYFQSIEGLWQSTKYPESDQDERWPLASWPFTRQQVERMSGFEAKRAGAFASQVMKFHNIKWVSFAGKKMVYRDPGKAEFYQLIYRATQAKVQQNPKVLKVLKATGGLELLPDHNQGLNLSPAWQYYKILQELRDQTMAFN